MEFAALVDRLTDMLPTQLVQQGGCILWPDGEAPTDEWLEARLTDARSALSRLSDGPPASLDDAARTLVEHAVNRRFIHTELEWRGVKATPPQLVMCARGFASILRGHLPNLVPGVEFRVDVIGDDAAQDEPLEVAVTFVQVRGASA